jgi:hypothetical protein
VDQKKHEHGLSMPIQERQKLQEKFIQILKKDLFEQKQFLTMILKIWVVKQLVVKQED